jgi:hypothetical protein
MAPKTCAWRIGEMPEFNLPAQVITPAKRLKRKGKSPLELFFDTWDEQFLAEIVAQSNQKMDRERALEAGGKPPRLVAGKRRKFKHISRGDLVRLFAVWLRMGLVKTRDMDAYWRADTRVPAVADVLPKNQFHRIKAALHFSNDGDAAAKTDSFHKVRPLLDHLNRRWKSQVLRARHNSLDESMVRFYGNHSARVCVPGKPQPVGYRINTLVSSNFLRRVEMSGDTTIPESAPGHHIESVIKRMIAGLLGQSDFLYVDRYFSSIPSFFALAQAGIRAVGSIASKRTKGAPLLTPGEWKQQPRGKFYSYITERPRRRYVNLVEWKDQKIVTLISNLIGVKPTDSIIRYQKVPGGGKKTPVHVIRPRLVQVYQMFNGQTDAFNRLVGGPGVKFGARKHYLPLVYWLFNASVVNTWTLYLHLNGMTPASMSLAAFRSRLSDELLNSLKPPMDDSPPPSPVATSVQVSVSVTQEGRTRRATAGLAGLKPTICDPLKRMPVWRHDRRSCIYRGCKGKVQSFCRGCNQTLCTSYKRNCFAHFHDSL